MNMRSCNKKDCREVFCTQKINGAYICDECVKDLLDEAKTWRNSMTRTELHHNVEWWMGRPKKDDTMVATIETIKSVLITRDED